MLYFCSFGGVGVGRLSKSGRAGLVRFFYSGIRFRGCFGFNFKEGFLGDVVFFFGEKI